jgi:hypothetical protein
VARSGEAVGGGGEWGLGFVEHGVTGGRLKSTRDSGCIQHW